MRSILVEVALGLVILASLGRVSGILVLKLRQARYAKRALAAPRTWRDVCTVPEPYLLGITTIALWLGRDVPAEPSAALLVQLGVGAGLALAAIVLMLWVLRSFPSVSTGHYVLPQHQVVKAGPYAYVRHPLYLAAYLVWLAVAIGFGSPVALALTAFYVVPSYWIYMRAEEAMLTQHLGEAYRDYRAEVGMLFPRSASRARASLGDRS